MSLDSQPTQNPATSVLSPPPSPTLSQGQPDGVELKRRLEKLRRHYDVDTMKMFMVVEALGEESLHAVYSGQRRLDWEPFLQRQEACRLDLARHEKTRDRYQQFLKKVSKEEQGRQWFLAVLYTMQSMGASDMFNYLSNHANNPPTLSASTTNNNNYSNKYGYNNNQHSPRRHESFQYPANTYRQRGTDAPDLPRHQEFYNPELQLKISLQSDRDLALMPLEDSPGPDHAHFCLHLVKLFEKKLEAWFEAFHAIAVRLTAHVKVAGLVRVLTGQIHALCTRQGRLHVVLIKVTAQETPRPLDVAELCLAKVMVIQNGLAVPEELSLALLTLHVHPARPVLRLWTLTPTKQMETAIRVADIDDMIDAGRLSQQHELWLNNTTADHNAVPTDTMGSKDTLLYSNH